MKYDALKKAHAKITSNRYLYYEPVLKPKPQDSSSGVFFGLAMRFFACGFIFALLLLFSQVPTLKDISSAVKSAVSYNIKIFNIQEDALPLKQKIALIFSQDNAPLEFGAPLKTQNIVFDGYNALLTMDQDPLVYSSETGQVINVTKNNGVLSIQIKHKNNIISQYTDIKYTGVKTGQTVKKGFPIGILAGEQLAFCLLKDGEQISLKDKAQWD